ncbi:MAG: CDP-alcohol phosphatidyltransferase family protein [Chitinispirillales bacterium]|nr:CDP-alcohol phosphatidyltransferase family protein [Chitinispirillales bacterium]
MNLATLITASRVAIAPVFAYLFIKGYGSDGSGWIYACVALAALIELSDIIDGTVARARKEVTDFGKVFDPVADSVSRQTVFIAFMVAGIIPLWMYLVFFYRDAFMQLLRIVCASSGVVLAARKSGKIKAVLQGIATFGVLAVVWAIGAGRMEAVVWGRHPGFWVMILPAVYTLLSVIDYIVPNGKLILKMMEAKNKGG